MSTQRDRWKVVDRLLWSLAKISRIYTGALYDDFRKCHARRHFNVLHPRTRGKKYARDLPQHVRKLLDRVWCDGAPDLRVKCKQ